MNTVSFYFFLLDIVYNKLYLLTCVQQLILTNKNRKADIYTYTVCLKET